MSLESRLLSVKEAAAYCGLSVKSFRNFAKKNNIKRVSGIYRYDIRLIDFKLDALIPVAKSRETGYSFESDLAKVKPYENISRRHKPN